MPAYLSASPSNLIKVIRHWREKLPALLILALHIAIGSV